jgi:hypothetical protein
VRALPIAGLGSVYVRAGLGERVEPMWGGLESAWVQGFHIAGVYVRYLLENGCLFLYRDEVGDIVEKWWEAWDVVRLRKICPARSLNFSHPWPIAKADEKPSVRISAKNKDSVERADGAVVVRDFVVL